MNFSLVAMNEEYYAMKLNTTAWLVFLHNTAVKNSHSFPNEKIFAELGCFNWFYIVSVISYA